MTVSHVTEKRANKRFGHKRSIPYLDMGDMGRYPEEISGKIQLIDLSYGGMRLRMEGVFPIEGSIVQIRIPVNGNLVAVPVFAQIKWAKKFQSKRYHVGLQFLA
jgi:c-di-GMP-binding flagellar brake protein YcgR